MDVPLYYQLDRTLTQSYIYKADREHIVEEIGVEDLTLRIVPTGNSKNSHAQIGIDLIGLENGWVKNWAVGCSGIVSGSGCFVQPPGYMEGNNQKGIEPASLFDNQLKNRL